MIDWGKYENSDLTNRARLLGDKFLKKPQQNYSSIC